MLKVTYRGGSKRVGMISLASILPNTDEYITYEVNVRGFECV